MNFPVRILAETKNSGLRADIYHFEHTASRIHSENILICHLKGDLNITFDARTFHVPPCAMLFVPTGQAVVFESSDAYVLLLYISDAALENRQFQIQLDSHDAPVTSAYLPMLSTIYQFFNPKIHQLAFHDLWIEKLCQDLLYQLLSGFCFPGTFQSSKNTDVNIPTTFSELLQFIDANYMENIQLKQLAASFYYTPSHLSKLFVHYTGQLFSDYLTGLRLSKALPLLLQTSMEISQISDRCGFPNARAFGQAFQKHYHVRPSVYRRQYYENDLDMLTFISDADWDILSELKIFDAFVDAFQSFHHTTENFASTPTPHLQRHYGHISLKTGVPTSIAGKNSILNIDFCRDLLMEDFQMQIRQLLKEFNYEYITLDFFLADDLQIYFSDNLNADFTIKDRSRRRMSYDFTLYDQIFHFIETTNLKPIIPLAYMPSFLAVNHDDYDPVFHSCKCMPFSMSEWQTYIYALFSHLYQKFGRLLSQARVCLWKVPDVLISHQASISEQDYFDLYLCTYQTLRAVSPTIAIDAPSVSCTASGFTFMKHFLDFCDQHHCLPEQLLFTYYHAENGHFHFPSSFLNCTNFFNSVQKYLKSHFPKTNFPLCMLNYNFVFGRADFVDALPGAMLPIIFSLNQSEQLVSVGMETALEYTTRTYFGQSQFSGTLSAMTAAGGKKAAYYSLKFLQSLGDEMVINKPGCCLTKSARKISMLLYYSIPVSEWQHEFAPETIETFYSDFPDMDFSITLSDLPFKTMVLQEQYLTPEYGSAYETWVKGGWHLISIQFDTRHNSPDTSHIPESTALNSTHIPVKSAASDSAHVATESATSDFTYVPAAHTAFNEPIYTSFPTISNKKIKATDTDSYTYVCRLRPFEIRLVEFIKI